MSIQNQIPLERPKHKNQVEDRFNPDKVKIPEQSGGRYVQDGKGIWRYKKTGDINSKNQTNEHRRVV